MNQGGDTIAGLDSNSVETCHVAEASQGHASVYASFSLGHHSMPSSRGSQAGTWSMQLTDTGSTENGIPSSSGYHHNQQRELTISRGAQDGLNSTSHASTTVTLGTVNGPQEYSDYTSYSSSSDPYGVWNTGYQGQGYYYGYQQQTNQSYSQPVGAYQSSGAPYQSLTSFQNTGSYVPSTSYSSTYYNAGDYQTTGGYQSSSYSNQTNSWNDGNYGNYPSQHYSNYTSSESNGAPSSTTVGGTPMNYQEDYSKQWAEYFRQNASDVSCAPGTENISATTSSTVEYPIPGISGGYAISNSQPPPPGTTSWKPDSSSSLLPSLQLDTYLERARYRSSERVEEVQTVEEMRNERAEAVPQAGSVSIVDDHNGCWNHVASGFQNKHPSYFQKPSDSNPPQRESFEDQQKNICPQGSNLQCPSTHQVPQNYQSQGSNLLYPSNYQVPQNFQPPLHTVPPFQTGPTLDTRQVSKLQIPTNPRIAPGLSLGMPKTEKDSPATNAASKPAYISVSVPKSNDKLSSHDAADAMLKPGMFPTSLRAYVERALARCKDDSQKAACQNIMKEMITKASADGTLFTQNWDIEPLFPLPAADSIDKNNLQKSIIASSLPKYKRSPSRRTKSRWEPISDEKLVEKLASVNTDPVKDVSWDPLKERDRMQQSFPSKNAQRPVKKPRVGDSLNATENGDSSSDSDKEQGLTAYYSSAIALANSPEERKKRENRFKRFEKGHGHRTDSKHFRPKGVGAGKLYNRRTNALLLSKNFDDGCSRAVEDIDWDALTVKGTCQEIEKRYLRLTSAPDPATVRPEEVLEKALLMVQSSQKNYLYKCDQLKSIRQDLTVQRIHNELTVKVYETHARLALEAGDLPEYNQCQSQLKNLYAEGIKGCHMEFSAYNLLCVILHSNNNRDLVSSMARLSAEAKKDEAVKHALAVRAAVTSGNYILFFRLYKTAPTSLSTCLMDLYVEKMRFEAVKCISRSYRPTVPVAFIARVLGFTNSVSAEGSDEKDTDGLEECEEWLRAHGASLAPDNNGEMQLDSKATSSSLYMPDPEDAVSHGDTSLAVNDFLTRTS
ncbi:SAC3/GANP/Nin1/mts3/eIF-3 p25 family isoform X2 [Tasmannia lanceolata]|uniref:SAC3/GANP/Nin1/mts3/eIF-3 p25 family isoform X2 n=1 Tax=Tasmannia lanceolata TaxID=3420 RepID=UPI004062BAE2